MDICNSKNRYLTIGTNKDNKLSLDINHKTNENILKDLLEYFKEAQYGTKLNGKMKINLLRVLIKHREAFELGGEPLGKIKGHDIKLCLDLERPYPPMLRRPPYPASLETRKEIEKHINELLEMGVKRNIGHNEIVEVTTPVLIAWKYGKYRMCGDFRALRNYTKEER
ncbi:hypothetical protein O181_025317 [Austropuccinia psidii MF-1]|uniref:Uncharacterized protein n=1 Tax=Austropuccinia psidii MF-1 TaxID=1389203 RepID=A0A9Q3CKX8_9BASI|nr:hypothetical protein [Austropuccinia psidii MF-1]